MKVHQALLQKGYFPKELPSVFTTQDFGTHVDDILEEWQAAGVFKKVAVPGKLPGGKKKRGAYSYKLLSAEAERISKPKRGYERRDIHITHPLPQALLAREIGTNWRSVQRWLSRQTFSEDEIRIGQEFERAIKGINFAVHEAKKSYLQATADWVVTTDITRFYPSIYTHSIAWAAYGKERVKQNLNAYQGSLADRLDLLIRSCNRNQTVGIPVGPETSRIIAETVSARIDQEYMARFPKVTTESIDRLQDDWTIGVGSLEEAEKVLSAVSAMYRGFSLDINGSKTSIDRIASERQSAWISEMGAFLSHRSGTLVGARLREFLELTLILQSQNPSAPVVSYALSVVEGVDIEAGDVPATESFLIKAAVVAPISLDRICRVILDIQNRTKSLSPKRIGQRFVNLTETALEKGRCYEAIWLLYTLRGLKRPVDIRPLFEWVATEPSATVALLLLDMRAKGLCVGKLPIQAWESKISEESVNTDWTWLLAYEGYRHGWLTDHLKLMDKPFFKSMATRDVVFYDPKRNIKTSSSEAGTRRNIRRKNMVEVRKLLSQLRGIEGAGY
ncbi:RNA-directed DNA polymerase [uncultured Tateyamaria sp.]|uniref:RNA-directed DNA polymerase n=1 Tax=uncultured Tateyamaria sp. TaxID=455651 RepID=UPI002612B12A|nr:RNA-directed DNA polymerase [uncultured Tateyamaria sp.]